MHLPEHTPWIHRIPPARASHACTRAATALTLSLLAFMPRAARADETERVRARVDEVFAPRPGLFWQPTTLLEAGTFGYAGGRVRWSDMLVRGHDLRFAAALGGPDYAHAALRDRWQLGPSYVGALAEVTYRGDTPFYGLGTASLPIRTHYTFARYDALALAGLGAGAHMRADLAAGYRHEDTGPGASPSVETRFDPDALPGYGRMDLLLATLGVRIDSRTRAEEAGGFRLEARGLYARDVFDRERQFGSAELAMDGAIEVARGHTLSASLYAMETFPLGLESVPFTHQAALGGDRHPGFTWGRFRGESAVYLETRYAHPVAGDLSAFWLAGAGNVFSRYFTDVTPGMFAASLGAGLRLRCRGRSEIDALLAAGTTRFDEPFGVESVRFVVQANTGP